MGVHQRYNLKSETSSSQDNVMISLLSIWYSLIEDGK